MTIIQALERGLISIDEVHNKWPEGAAGLDEQLRLRQEIRIQEQTIEYLKAENMELRGMIYSLRKAADMARKETS